MFGLMTVKAHKAILARKEEEAYQAWRKVADERDKYRNQVRDTCTRAEKAEASLKTADNQTSAAVRDRDALRRQLDEAKAEAASLRPDAEWARARKAKAAEYEASKRVRKAAKKGAA